MVTDLSLSCVTGSTPKPDNSGHGAAYWQEPAMTISPAGRHGEDAIMNVPELQTLLEQLHHRQPPVNGRLLETAAHVLEHISNLQHGIDVAGTVLRGLENLEPEVSDPHRPAAHALLRTQALLIADLQRDLERLTTEVTGLMRYGARLGSG